MNLDQHYIDDITKFSGTTSNVLASLPMPHRRIETWKYTNLNKAFAKNYSFEKQAEAKRSLELDPDFYHMSFINGELSMMTEELERLVKFKSLEFYPDEIHGENYYQNDFISLLNQAAQKTGHAIKFKKGTELERPIFIHHYFSVLAGT